MQPLDLIILQVYSALQVYSLPLIHTKFFAPLRTKKFEDATEDVENSLKLRNLSKTRWLARSESIRAAWSSLSEVQEALDGIANSADFDEKTKSQAVALVWDLQSVDFVISIMFMKNIMQRMHQMTCILQGEELNVVDAMTVIESTVALLKRVRANDQEMDDQIDAGVEYLKKLGVEDAEAEFRRKHRMRRMPIRFDPNQATTAQFTFKEFYRKQFRELLDVLIEEYGKKLKRAFETLKPLMVVLKPPLVQPSFADVEDMVKFFPVNRVIDAHILYAEFCNFV